MIKNHGYLDSKRKCFGRYTPYQNIDLRLNGGANDVFGGEGIWCKAFRIDGGNFILTSGINQIFQR